MFFNIINRGKLKAPSDQFFMICCTCYQLFCQLKNIQNFQNFISLPNPAYAFGNLIYNFIRDNDTSFICVNFHDCYVIFNRMVLSFFNTLARNYVRSAYKTVSNDKHKIIKLSSQRPCSLLILLSISFS